MVLPELVDALMLAGFDVWFDKQGLYVGDQWISKLETELESILEGRPGGEHHFS